MSKEYTYKLVIRSAYDSFWESDPSDKEVTELVRNTLERDGIFYDDFDLKLIKFEEKEELF